MLHYSLRLRRNSQQLSKVIYRAVIEYYNLMKGFWLELDYYQDFKMKFSEDAAILKQYVERERIFEFLAGLKCRI